MKRRRYSDEQVPFAPRQAEGGIAAEQIRHKLGVVDAQGLCDCVGDTVIRRGRS